MAAEKKAEKKPATRQFGDDRKKALEVALGKIEKDFGKGSVMKLGSAASNMQVEVIPTGSLQLDFALGVGGLPKGRIVEIYGPESSGKTTVALHCVAQAQKAGGEALVRSGAIDIVVVDSVAALVPKAEIEGDMGDSHVGLQARLMSQALRKLTGVISKTNAVVIFINQLREKVGVLYGNPETTTGGKALKFYASVRIDIRKSEPIKEGKEIVGNRTKIKIVKNKVAPPFRTCVVDMLYGEGISREGELLDIAVEQGLVQKAGSFYSYNGERIGQGRDNARRYFRDNPEAYDAVEAKIRESFKSGGIEAPLDTSAMPEEDEAVDDEEFELDE